MNVVAPSTVHLTRVMIMGSNHNRFKSPIDCSARELTQLLAVVWMLVGSGSQSAAAEQILSSNSNEKAQQSDHQLPPSDLLTTEEREAVRQWHLLSDRRAVCLDAGGIVDQRKCFDSRLLAPLLEKQLARFKVKIQASKIAGVSAEIVTPSAGPSESNSNRVLINLHGGGFVFGGRIEGEVESIPIASVGRITVISVNYRMAPEHVFPAATEDVVAVYRELLSVYNPENIGIYGCSAGGLLTAQVVAWIHHVNLPRPGAIGMFCGAAGYWTAGDSGASLRAAAASQAESSRSGEVGRGLFPGENSYFRGVDLNDPLVFPIYSREILSRFPPSLLLSATRDLALSSVVHTHSMLVQLGVEAELHVWEGLDHGFFIDPEIPQSQQVYGVTAEFFDRHLGRATKR